MHIIFVLFLPVVGFVGLGVLYILTYCYHTIVVFTANGGTKMYWPSDTFVDRLFKLPYVVYIVLIAITPAMICSAILAKHIGLYGMIFPLLFFWLFLPVIQLSSLYASSAWIPFTPSAIFKMLGRPSATTSFYLLTFPLALLVVSSFTFAIWNQPQSFAAIFGVCFLFSLSLFVYCVLLGRLTFICAFAGDNQGQERSKKLVNQELPQYTADRRPEEPVRQTKKKKKKSKKQQQQQNDSQENELRQKPRRSEAMHGDEGDEEEVTAYGLNMQEPDRPTEPEEEKEFVPPKFHYDDEEVTAYDAKPAEIDIKTTIPKEFFELKESEMKLLEKSESITEPSENWPKELWAGFFGYRDTFVHLMFVAGALFVLAIIMKMLWSFL